MEQGFRGCGKGCDYVCKWRALSLGMGKGSERAEGEHVSEEERLSGAGARAMWRGHEGVHTWLAGL